MSLLSLIFDRPEKLRIQVPKGEIESLAKRDLLIIDAADTITHNNEAQPTEHPVEEGIDISDNIDLKPAVVSFEGIVSEAPITIEAAIIGNVAGAVGALAGKTLGSVGGGLVTGAVAALGGALLNDQASRVQEAYNALIEIQKKKILCTIITGLTSYENMQLSEFKPVETSMSGGSLVFSATFTEIRIVKSEQVVLPQKVLSSDVSASGGSVSNQGKKTANEADDDVSGRGSSFLSDITGIGA